MTRPMRRATRRGFAAGGAVLALMTLSGAAATQATASPHPLGAQTSYRPVAAAPQGLPQEAPRAAQAAPQQVSAGDRDHRYRDGHHGHHEDRGLGGRGRWGMRAGGFVDGVLAGTSYGYAFGSRYGQFGGYPYGYGQGYYNQYPYGQYPYGSTYPYGTNAYPYGSSTYPYGTNTYPYGTNTYPYGTNTYPYGANTYPYTYR